MIGLTDAQLAAEFLAKHDGFRLVYDEEPEQLAVWVGTRWDVRSSRRKLKQAVYRFLVRKYNDSPAPEPEKTDPYRALQQSDKTSSVATAVEYELCPIRRSEFDRHDYLLALPGEKTADLLTGEFRESRMEDYLTRRLYVAPAEMATERFDLFMDEITLNDAELKTYLLRLMALCLTGQAEQVLVFWYGTGANGKGVLTRLLVKLLGEGSDGFVCSLRPNEVAKSGDSDDRQKRAFSRFPGVRLVTVNESVSEGLDFAMLKLMSGGDVVTGAKMRQDAKPIRPTWKTILPTNTKPELPPDSAFRTRVHLVPFNAVFERNTAKGKELETQLERELPGILWKMIQLCPDVVKNGLRPPESVRAATTDLFEEMDFAGRFRAEILTDGGVTAYTDMSVAVTEWVKANNLSRHTVKAILEQLKAAPGVEFGRTRIDGKQVRAYMGVSLSEPAAVKLGGVTVS